MIARVVTAATLFALASTSVARAADPTTADCLGASESSLKLANQHKLRAARSQLLVCAAASCPGDIRSECLHRVDEINAQIPTVVFSAKDAQGADLTAVRITMDGEVLTEHLEGTAMSIDPGPHAFTFEAPGQPPVTRNLVIVEGQKDRRELVTLGAVDAPAPPTPSAPDAAAASVAGTEAPQPSSGNGTRVAGFVLGGVGLAGIGIGATLLGLASSLSHRSQQEFTSDRPSADSDHQAALHDQTAAFLAGGAGIAALAVGVVLIVTSHHAASSRAPAPATGLWLSPQLGAGAGGLALRGAF